MTESKYQFYPEYKDSGLQWLGEIPTHWEIIQSRRLFMQRKERAKLGDEQLTASQKYGIIAQKKYMELENQRVVQVLSGSEILKHIEPDDFVISMRSFQGGLEWCKQPGCVSSAYIGLIPIKHVVPEFFAYLFKCGPYIQALQSTSNLVRDGQALRFDNFSQVWLPIISDTEQQKIANFLDHETAKIDILIEKQKQLIKLLIEKRQAVISHSVTKGLNPKAPMLDSGVAWFGDVPKNWKVAGFTKYLNKIVDYRGKTPEKHDSGIFLITAKNIKNGSLNYSASKEYVSIDDYESVMSRGKPKIGDVLFTTEAPLGEVALVDREDIALAQRVIKFDGVSGVIINHYLKFLIMSNQFQNSLIMFASGSTALGIKVQRLVYLKALIPSVAEQTEIVSHIDLAIKKIDRIVFKAQTAIEVMKERRAALVSAAVTGKIDLRNWQAPEPSSSNASEVTA